MMDLRELLGKLQGVEAHGNGQYMARCPCHDDRKASLAVRMGEKGIVLHCLAGCATEDILQSLGVTVRDITLSEHWRGAKTQAPGWGARQAREQEQGTGRSGAATGRRRVCAQEHQRAGAVRYCAGAHHPLL